MFDGWKPNLIDLQQILPAELQSSHARYTNYPNVDAHVRFRVTESLESKLTGHAEWP